MTSLKNMLCILTKMISYRSVLGDGFIESQTDNLISGD